MKDTYDIIGCYSSGTRMLVNTPAGRWIAWPMNQQLYYTDVDEEYRSYFAEVAIETDNIDGILVTEKYGPMWNDEDPCDGWQLERDGEVILIVFKKGIRSEITDKEIEEMIDERLKDDPEIKRVITNLKSYYDKSEGDDEKYPALWDVKELIDAYETLLLRL